MGLGKLLQQTNMELIFRRFAKSYNNENVIYNPA